MFESSLIALEEKKHRRRLAPLPIAVGLHLAVLASIGLAEVWNVGDVGEPPLPIVFISAAALPPMPPAPAGGSQRPQTPTEAPTAPSTPVQPDTEVLPDLPSNDPAPASSADGTFVEGGSPTGSRDGIVGGIDIGGVPGGDPHQGQGGIGWTGPMVEPQPQTEIVRYNGTMTRPVQLSGRPPRYTELARRAGIQGTVILEAVIDKKGRVSNVRVLKGLPMGLDAEAVTAVEGWTFEPAKMEGRPVAVYYTLTVHFEVLR